MELLVDTSVVQEDRIRIFLGCNCIRLCVCVYKPVCDEFCLLQQGSEVSFGCDVLVFDVVFKLPLSLLQTQINTSGNKTFHTKHVSLIKIPA